MQIIYDHQIFYLQKYGGISRYFFELASIIAKSTGDTVRIAAPLYINSYLQDAPSELRIIGTLVQRWPHTGRICMSINSLISRPLFSVIRPDIVHETYYLAHRLAPKRSRIVLSVYDMIHEKFPEFFRANDRTSRDKLAAVKRADHIICISESTRRDLIELFSVPSEKTTVIHLGFSFRSLSEPNLLVPTDRPYILYVGARNCHKNFDRLLSVYSQSVLLQRDAVIVAFGGGTFSLDERTRIRQLGIDGSKIFHVSGDDSVLGTLYRNAFVFVYPSLYEGFGIPPLEAMNFDCPVVCSNTSSMPEVAGDAANYFDPHNLEEMRQKIEEIFESTSKRNCLIERGRKRLQYFSWDKCASETLKVYNNLV